MIRTAIISVFASFILFSAWAVNVVSYHTPTGLKPLMPLTTNFDRK